MDDTKSSYEWIKELKSGVIILDPDGWDRQNFDASLNEKITKAQFLQRFMMSTVTMPADGDIWKAKE